MLDLAVDEALNQAAWNEPDRRRQSFHSPSFAKQFVSLRSSDTLLLSRNIDRRIGDLASVRALTGTQFFSGMAVLKGQELVYEAYAPDFGPDKPHSMQSITKTNTNLIIGRLVRQGLLCVSYPQMMVFYRCFVESSLKERLRWFAPATPRPRCSRCEGGGAYISILNGQKHGEY